ncbi:MAG: radical SAM protein, partial [Lachnospiraceae bacterium]|nr:radical SAM protein [Lachnospiraceae bacterium]
IRLMYCYPEEITDELIDTIAEEPKLCHYLDIPIQHASDEILRRMGRRTDQKSICSLIGKLRERIPDIVLRTTLMTGFPGETEEDFETLADFVNEMEFDRLGVFAYSAEEGTKAAQMSGQIPDEVKEKRREEIMLLQQEIAYDLNRERIGKRMTVFIEGKLTEENTFVGRTYMDAPEVDGLIFLPATSSAREWMSGDFAEVFVTDAKGYDLIGEFIDESAK